MSAATCQVSVGSDRRHWRCEPLGVDVACADIVLETIRHEAVDSFSRLSHGGLETGGILFGRRTGGLIEILGAIPVDCEHKLGPSYILSSADEFSFQQALTSPKMGTLQPVGLYMSHSRRGLALAESDRRILDRYFPEPWHMALLLTPSKAEPTRVGFFIRGPASEPAFSCFHEIVLSPPGRRQETGVAEYSGDSADSPASAVTSPPITAVTAQRVNRWKLPATVGLLLLFLLGAGLLLGPRLAPPPAVPMRVTDLGAQLRIEWDPAQRAVRTAQAGIIEIRDGGSKPVAMPITRSGLNSGSVLYMPQSESVEVRLKLMYARATPSESVIYFINPAHHAAAPTAPAPIVSAEIRASTSPIEISRPLPRPAEKKPPKIFHVPERPLERNAPQRASISLLDVPVIHGIPAASPALPSTLLAASASSVGPPQLRTGRLIWTGSLHKNTVLSITPAGASTGVLNGRLPGVPVKISLEPAELVDGGIAIFSKENMPPTAWNGWSIFFYEWDPKRIAEVNVVEPPGPANDWKRLVLRSGKRNVSVVVVDWQPAIGQ